MGWHQTEQRQHMLLHGADILGSLRLACLVYHEDGQQRLAICTFVKIKSSNDQHWRIPFFEINKSVAQIKV